MKIRTQWTALFLALLFACCGAFSAAAGAAAATDRDAYPYSWSDGYTPSELNVGVLTPPTGSFYGKLFGLNTTDMDIRLLLHGLGTVANTENYAYSINKTAVAKHEVTEEPDGSHTHTFTLRDGLKYSDGTPIGAADYVFTVLLESSGLIRQLGGDNSRYTELYGYDAYAAGEHDVFAGVHLIDSKTFSLTIGAKYLPFFYELTAVDVTPTPIGVVAPGCRVTEDGSDGARIEGPLTAELLQQTLLGDAGYLTSPAVTSGPYCMAGFDPATGIAELWRNRYYAGDYAGKIPTIDIVRVIPVTYANMADMLQSGRVDVVHKITSLEGIQAVMRLNGVATRRYPRSGYGYVTFNCEQPTVGSENVRKAIAYALDKDALVKAFGGSYASRVYGMYGMAQWAVRYELIDEKTKEKTFVMADELRRLPRYAFDLDKAEQLLVDDGWTLDENGGAYTPGVSRVRAKMIDGQLVTLTLRFGVTQGSAISDMVARQLSENLPLIGAQIETTTLTYPEVQSMVYRQTDRAAFDMFTMGSNFDYLFDPYYMFNTDPAYDGTLNTTALHSPDLMALALEMRQTIPGHDELYARRWLSFQRAWAQELPTIPLYTNDNVDALASRVSGWRGDSMNSWATGIASVRVG